MPTYGEEYTKGFFLRDLGYYFTFGDKADLALRGGIYTLGSWEAKAASNYVKRYKVQQQPQFRLLQRARGRKGEHRLTSSKNNVLLKWTHQQDPKANPGSTFSASVNFATSGFGRYSASSINDILATQTNSTISYSKNWAGTPFSLSANMAVSQNSSTEKIDITLPNIVFNVSRFKTLRPQGSRRQGAVVREDHDELYGQDDQPRKHQGVGGILERDAPQYEQRHRAHAAVSASFNLFNYINVSPSFQLHRAVVRQARRAAGTTARHGTRRNPRSRVRILASLQLQRQPLGHDHAIRHVRDPEADAQTQAVRHTITPRWASPTPPTSAT